MILLLHALYTMRIYAVQVIFGPEFECAKLLNVSYKPHNLFRSRVFLRALGWPYTHSKG